MSDTYPLPNGQDFLLKVAYTRKEISGVTILIAVSVVSAIAVLGLLAAISLSAFSTRGSTNQNLFVRSHVAAYFISLVVSDLLQVAGSLMNAKWIHLMAVEYDGFCTVQGIFKQAADVGIAVWSLIIAIHTFNVLFLHLEMRRFALYAALIGGWSTVAVIMLAGPATVDETHRGPFFGISGYWCWISDEYTKQRITLDYMIMFISALLSFLLYSLVFFRLRGNIIVHGWHISFRFTGAVSSHRGNTNSSDSYVMTISRQMMLYPIAYTIIILPIAAARFSEWSGHEVPFAVTVFCDTVYLFSGTVNVILFSTTRRILPPRSILANFTISKPRLLESASVVSSNEADPYSSEADPYYRESTGSMPINEKDQERGSWPTNDDPPMLKRVSLEGSDFSLDLSTEHTNVAR